MPKTSVILFAIASCAVYATMVIWAFRRRKDPNQWFYFWLLIVGVMFWWIGESLAIRLGKYAYAPFLLTIPGGSPASGDWLGDVVKKYLIRPGEAIEGCAPNSWSIPFPVVALEAALVFSFLRLADLRLVRDGWRSAFATAGLSGLLMVNLTAILDPVVSTSGVCSVAGEAPGNSVLTFGLWHWFTNAAHPGLWYGVPLVNYSAWFFGTFAFSLLVRLDDEGPGGIIRKHDSWFGYLRGGIVFLLVLFALVIGLKYSFDLILVHGQDIFPAPIVDQSTWQFGVLGMLLLVFGVSPIVLLGRPRDPARVDAVSCLPQLMVFAYCGAALVVQPHGPLILLWVVTLCLASMAMFWPNIVGYRDKRANLAHGEKVTA